MLKVRDIMSRVVLTLAAEDSAASAAECLSRAAISGAPVRDKNGKLVGMLSQADLTNVLRAGGHRHPTVSEVMTPEVFTVYADGPALVAAAVMAKYDIHRVAVWNAAGALTGMVTSLDLVKALARGARFDVEVAAGPRAPDVHS